MSADPLSTRSDELTLRLADLQGALDLLTQEMAERAAPINAQMAVYQAELDEIGQLVALPGALAITSPDVVAEPPIFAGPLTP